MEPLLPRGLGSEPSTPCMQSKRTWDSEWRDASKSEIDSLFLLAETQSEAGGDGDDISWNVVRDNVVLYPFTSYYALKYLTCSSKAAAVQGRISLENHVKIWSRWALREALENLQHVIAATASSSTLFADEDPSMVNMWSLALDKATRHDHEELTIILSSNQETVLGLDDAALQAIVNLLETLPDCIPVHSHTLWRLVDKIVNRRNILPRSLFVENTERVGQYPIKGGGFADVYQGALGGELVALKVLRIFVSKTEQIVINKAFCKEAMVWRRLKHPNVLPFQGICVDLFLPRYAFVSPWMAHGQLLDYLKEHPDADRETLMNGFTKGLSYLHSHGIIHSDIRSPNVLVDQSNGARIADFGLARVLDTSSRATAATGSSAGHKGAVRWQAPELLMRTDSSGESGKFTTKSDVYAYACVVVEIFTGEVPFRDLKVDGAVVLAVMLHNEHPRRPPGPATTNGLNDDLWSLLQSCWSRDPADRPDMQHIAQRLQCDDSCEEQEELTSSINPSGHPGKHNRKQSTLAESTADRHLIDTPRPHGMIPHKLAPSPACARLPAPSCQPYIPEIRRSQTDSLQSPMNSTDLTTTTTIEKTNGSPVICSPKKSATEQEDATHGSSRSPTVYDDDSTPVALTPTDWLRTPLATSFTSKIPATTSPGRDDGLFTRASERIDVQIPETLDAGGMEYRSGQNEASTSPISPRRPLPRPPISLSSANHSQATDTVGTPTSIQPTVVNQLDEHKQLSSPMENVHDLGRPKLVLDTALLDSRPIADSEVGLLTDSRSTRKLPPNSSSPRTPRPLPALPEPPEMIVPPLQTTEIAATHSNVPDPNDTLYTHTPRPPTEYMYDRLEEFFPAHDIDKPIIEVMSGERSPITKGPTPQHFDTPRLKRSKRRISIRNVAHEYKDTLNQMSDALQPSISGIRRRRSTILWGSKVEEVTPLQAKAGILSPSPTSESPSSEFFDSKPIFRWVKGELLGKGAYSRVYLALIATTGELITVKQIEFSKVKRIQGESHQSMPASALECENLKDLDHPNIVQYIGFEQSPAYLSIFLEYVPGGTIASHLHRCDKFDDQTTRFFTKQILSGLKYLHAKGVIHGNLKPNNILVDPLGVCKISDHGIYEWMDNVYFSGIFMQANICWMAPEFVQACRVVEHEGYSEKIDIWSLGCLVFHMWTGQKPWENRDFTAVVHQLLKMDSYPWTQVFPDFLLAESADDFRTKCFAISPDDRPTASELCKHPYTNLHEGWAFSGFPWCPV